MTYKFSKQSKPLFQKEDDILNILKEDEKSLLLSLSKDIISCNTKEDIQNIISSKLAKYLKEINEHKFQMEQENFYLKEQIKISHDHSEVIGSNNGLKKVFQLISNVASSDSTVLILGETGSGKELIAKAVHNSSARKDKLMVKLNCAAFPAQLIESELFGHEKGSFTGATERRIGKFELANNSTLFLDEIGEMTLELQVKLLRAIQEKEIERIGGNGIIKTNVRLIAATNRDLKREVELGKFRADLYYRLNVFPIILPSLRERKEDIPLLVAHFINKFASKSGKKIASISPKTLKDIILYDWPGNVRELEHIIERTVLITTGNMITQIQVPQSDKKVNVLHNEKQIKTLAQNERDYIVSVLKKCNGRIRGSNGAAAILNVPPTTLHSKIKKLGIKKIVA